MTVGFLLVGYAFYGGDTARIEPQSSLANTAAIGL